MAKNSKKNRLPFEPSSNKKKPAKTAPTSTTKVDSKSSKDQKSSKNSNSDASLSAIPKAVSNRMVRRMLVFSGIPTALGISSFFIFYWLFSRNLLDFPPYLVVFVSAGLFGLGVIGLSYSIFSASWDENRPGGIIGFSEFKINFGRTVSAWRNGRKKA
ncbi:MAG: PAM68 family protein [Xenococcaceae cyanobacterium MO_167.B52]|nr:PAM68 family protein [Xenococcaceae cyanobacterium MO_167.B52]